MLFVRESKKNESYKLDTHSNTIYNGYDSKLREIVGFTAEMNDSLAEAVGSKLGDENKHLAFIEISKPGERTVSSIENGVVSYEPEYKKYEVSVGSKNGCYLIRTLKEGTEAFEAMDKAVGEFVKKHKSIFEAKEELNYDVMEM